MIKKLNTFGLAVALIFFASTFSPIYAATQAITLELGASSGLLLDRPFKTILIGDPDIVDVLERGDRSVIFQSLKLGAFGHIVVLVLMHLLYRIKVLAAPQAEAGRGIALAVYEHARWLGLC